MNKTYKAKLHIPTREYEFIEIELNGTPEEITETNRHFNSLVKQNGDGIPIKEFNQAIDRYLIKGTGLTETYLAMSKSQQDIFQTIKKAFSRINKK